MITNKFNKDIITIPCHEGAKIPSGYTIKYLMLSDSLQEPDQLVLEKLKNLKDKK
tara:strand:- start:11065 stop:11229 length:165 start_codon:yes stop_codon:yes gene_type:complete